MECDRISVIVVTYNSARTVIETLESIYNQTFVNIELIVTDDNSRDDTVERVENWLEEKKQRFFNTDIIKAKSNTGVAGNCNRGVRATSTFYYKIIAGDDVLYRDAIQQYVNFANSHQCAIGVSRVVLFGRNAEAAVKIWKTAFEKGYEKLSLPMQKKYRQLVVRNFICAPAVGLIKREWFEKVGGFDERYPFCEDYTMYIKLMELGIDFELMDEVLVKYRVSEEALSAGNSPLLMRSTLDYFWKEKLCKLLKNCSFFEAIKQFIYYGMIEIQYRYKGV